LRAILARAGLTPRDVLSTRSRPYRELGLAERVPSDDELIGLMVERPALIRRPLALGPSGVAVGFDRAALGRLASEEQEDKGDA
jgi:arsenate reductase-like glutaredoxin family protein